LLLAGILLAFLLAAHFMNPDKFRASAYGCNPASPDACFEMARFRDLNACHEYAKLAQPGNASLIRCAVH
jgi:hypothetical protein